MRATAGRGGQGAAAPRVTQPQGSGGATAVHHFPRLLGTSMPLALPSCVVVPRTLSRQVCPQMAPGVWAPAALAQTRPGLSCQVAPGAWAPVVVAGSRQMCTQTAPGMWAPEVAPVRMAAPSCIGPAPGITYPQVIRFPAALVLVASPQYMFCAPSLPPQQCVRPCLPMHPTANAVWSWASSASLQ